MSRLIDADALERDGWMMSRTVRVNKDTMEFQTRKPTDFPTIEPQRMRGRWIPTEPDEPCFYQCSLCRCLNDEKDNFCKNCGAKMGGTE